MNGLCECGCGERTRVADRTHRRHGQIKGVPLRYIPGHQFRARGPRLKRMVKFEDVVEILPDDGCWLWHAKLHPSGYGHLRLDGKTLVHAHRAFYEAFVGPIPRGAHVHHKCQVTRCVNPLHLAPISPAEHARLHHAREPVKEAA